MNSEETLDGVDDLPALSARAARLWPDRVGLIFDRPKVSLTFGDIERRSNRFAHALAEVGVSGGDRVAVMLPNVAAFPLLWLAIAKLGATLVPLNVYYRELDAGYIVRHSGAKVVVTSATHVALLQRVVAALEPAPALFSIDDTDGVPNLTTLAQDEGPVEAVVWPETLVNIQYTSGTTGRPKGCMLSHRFWATMTRTMVVEFPGLGTDDTILTAQPFYYMDPQWNVAVALGAGAPLVVLDRFHPATFWDKVREYGVTFFYCLGVMPTLMLKVPVSPHDHDHRVRLVACSAIPATLHTQIEDRWGVGWYEAFGMTETGIDIAVRHDEHDALVGTGCIGRPMRHREARIAGDDDRPLPRGDVGELLLRGHSMMDGYYRNPEATAEAFRGGWLHTGDLARMDDDGRIFYVGRAKDMIRRSGENISAQEVEECLTLHDKVVSAACLAVRDELRGEEVKAYVVLHTGQTPDSCPPQELSAFCEQRLAYFKVPRYWEYRDDLPRTPSERIAKGALREEKTDLRAGSYDRVDGMWR